MCARLGLVVFDVAETSLLSRCEIHVGLGEVAKHKVSELREIVRIQDPMGRRSALQ